MKLPNNNDHKQAPLVNDNSSYLIRFSLLPQLYHLGKTDVELKIIRPTSRIECPLRFGVANFPVICVFQCYSKAMVAQSLKSTFLNETLFDVTTQPPTQSNFF